MKRGPLDMFFVPVAAAVPATGSCALYLQVLLPMTGTADRDTLCQGLSAHVLQLLHYLTATWQPTALQQQAWQILAGPPQLLPSTSSVAAPALIIDSLPQRQPEDAQQLQCSTSNRGSATEAVVAELLHVLSHGCHVESWPQLPCQDVVTAAGAALSALYSCCIQDACVLTMPASATETIQVSELRSKHTITELRSKHSSE